MKRGTIAVPLFSHPDAVVKRHGQLAKIALVGTVARRSRQVPAAANNLPRYLTSFVGRENELRALKASVRSSRLVTLVGAGGAEKVSGPTAPSGGGHLAATVEPLPSSDPSSAAREPSVQSVHDQHVAVRLA